MRRNIHKIEQYLINVTGCDIINKSEMYIVFNKLSSSSRQIQKIVFVFMKKCVFTDNHMIMLHHFYCKVGKTACSIFSCILRHTEEKMAAALLTAALKTFCRN